MLSDDLFNEVLIEPAKNTEVDRLLIVSGYATASMADRHLEKLHELSAQISIDLIVGMSMLGGMEKAQHLALKKLNETGAYGNNFNCSYITQGNPIHAKTYVWMRGDEPIVAFVGSANYTMRAFGQSQIEAVNQAEPSMVRDFFENCSHSAVNCRMSDIENQIAFPETERFTAVGEIDTKERTGAEQVTLLLLDSRTGETPKRSGINWGQRHGRDKNQAYINIPVRIRDSQFFPERYEQFTVLTDDGDSFIFVRAQDGGKGLHTTHNNALLGEYFRKRLGLKSGEFVTREHLEAYGRTNVIFIKIDEETYLMDFAPTP